ncbi:MAG: indolepyruvate ferredoxin oxidoreductase subunit beta [Chloroflexi bacterium]|nr:indolepyruvate ferredoxin oxidoreductase subunit beta [Chloroflexota bacterium]
MVKEFNVLIAGVGGQGVILMSELLGKAAVRDGLRVRGSEVLGMAIRGGSVVSMIRLGDEVYGPLIPLGKGDALVAMELAEGLRNIAYLSKSSVVILNTQRIVPATVLIGKSNYPSLEEVVEILNAISNRVVRLDAARIAEEAGSFMTANIVMLGALSAISQLPVKVKTIKESIQDHFSGKLAQVNLKAFDLGYQACQQA